MKKGCEKYIMRFLVVLIMVLLSVSAFSQSLKDSKSTPPMGEVEGALSSTLFGLGTNNVLDTYLSPYNYTGGDIRFMHEYIRQTKKMDGKIYYQSLLDINGSYLTNKSKSANDYVAGIRYSNAWMYNITSSTLTPQSPSAGNFAVLAGLQPSVYLGGVYNTRNGNNPAQAKFDIMLNATAMAVYNLRLFKRTFPLRYQLTIPLLGIAYSPNYGQSYYEEFVLDHYDHNICFAHIANMPSMRHLLTLDIPIRRNYLSIGWSGEFNQAKLNGLRYHSYSNNFIIGYKKHF